MKRAWGFDHIMTKKTKERASADVGFIFIAYNFKRIINIIGIDELMKIISSFLLSVFVKNPINSFKSIICTFKSVNLNLKILLNINGFEIVKHKF